MNHWGIELDFIIVNKCEWWFSFSDIYYFMVSSDIFHDHWNFLNDSNFSSLTYKGIWTQKVTPFKSLQILKRNYALGEGGTEPEGVLGKVSDRAVQTGKLKSNPPTHTFSQI